MKKRFKFLALFTALCAISGTTFAGSTLTAAAATKTTTVTEDFNSKLQKSKWTTNSENICSKVIGENNNVLRLGAFGAGVENSAILSKNAITADTSDITFDLFLHTSDWMQVYFNEESPNEINNLKGSAYIWTTAMNGIPHDTWVKVKIVLDSVSNTVKICYSDDGNSYTETQSKELEFIGRYLQFNFATDHSDNYAYLDNFKFNSSSGSVEESFETCETIEDSALFCSVSTALADHSIVDIAPKELCFNGANTGEYIVSNVEMTADVAESFPYATPVIDAKFTLTIPSSDAAIGYVLGVGRDEDSGVYNCMKSSYVIKFTQTQAEVIRYGETGTPVTKDVSALSNLSSGGQINIKVTKDGKLSLSQNGVSKIRDCVLQDFGGFNGFVALSEINSNVCVEDFSIINNYYIDRLSTAVTTKSVNTNFELDYFGEEGHEDFVYRASAGTMEVTNGELVITKCDDDSYFGPNYEYENFIAEFKLTSLLTTDSVANKNSATAPNRWIGFDFGRRSATVFPYGTYATLLVPVTNPTEGGDDANPLVSDWNTTNAVLWHDSRFSDLSGKDETVNRGIPTSYFKNISYDGVTKTRDNIDKNDAVCFRFVGQDDTLSLYVKSVKEDEYKLYYQVKNVNTRGYISIVMTGYLFATIDDFSVSNTSDVYNIADTYIPHVTIDNVIYDRGNVDVNMGDELALNKNNGGNGFLVPFIVSASVAVAAVSGLVGFVIVSKKKK